MWIKDDAFTYEQFSQLVDLFEDLEAEAEAYEWESAPSGEWDAYNCEGIVLDAKVRLMEEVLRILDIHLQESDDDVN
jgi:hypothetical protein